MRDQDETHPSRTVHGTEQVEDLRLGRHVERRRRLVGDQQVRIATQAQRRARPAGASHPKAGTGSAARPAGRRSPLRPAAAASRPGSGLATIAAPSAGSISAMCSPQRSSGFSIVNGSWNMQRDHSTSKLPHLLLGKVHQFASPVSDAALGEHTLGSSRAIARAVSDLPEPDSPTIPTVSPAPTSRSVPTVIVRRWVPDSDQIRSPATSRSATSSVTARTSARTSSPR